MLKILNTSQIRAADLFTIENEPISSTDLMERAAQACADALLNDVIGVQHPLLIVCGPGNNGGDGLAIARLLITYNLQITVCIPPETSKLSDDFRINLERLEQHDIRIISLEELTDADFTPETLVIDALFGSGLDKTLEGVYREIVSMMNRSKCRIVSIDMPAGLYADKPAPDQAVVHADKTLSFEFPKLSFLFPENEAFTGKWEILSIGLHPDFIEKEPATNFLIETADIRATIRHRHKFAHKGDFGHALLIGGSQGKIGAAVLMGKSCLRAGSGLATVHLPACGLSVIQSAVPELMASVDSNELICSRLPLLNGYSAVACGPGLGIANESASMLKLLIQEAKVPMLLDADALNIISENPTWLGFLRPGTILTPHPGEFARLAGKTNNSYERLETLKGFCRKYNVYVVLKGAHTVTCSPSGNCFFNNTGNPGMATAGSGDVLTGIIAGFLAQGYQPLDACITGVWLHGQAGDIAARKTGEHSLMAGDLIESLGKAFNQVCKTDSYLKKNPEFN